LGAIRAVVLAAVVDALYHEGDAELDTPQWSGSARSRREPRSAA